MSDKLEDANNSIISMCNDLWGLLYPEDPTGWEYRTQPIVHIRIELDSLKKENVKLRGVLTHILVMAAEDIRTGDAEGTILYQIEADARAALE